MVIMCDRLLASGVPSGGRESCDDGPVVPVEQLSTELFLIIGLC